jgi:hypothetical protein
VRAHGEEGWCESRCDVKKSRKAGNETAVSKKQNPSRIHSNYEEQETGVQNKNGNYISICMTS